MMGNRNAVSVFNVLTVRKDGEVRFILVKDFVEDRKGETRPAKCWKLCGGGVEEEIPHHAAIREVGEEIGLIVYDPKETIYEWKKKDRFGNVIHRFLVFAPAIYGGKLKRGKEIAEIEIFSREELDDLSRRQEIFYRHNDALYKFLNEANLNEIARKSPDISELS